MIYVVKIRVLSLLLNLLGKYKSKPEVKLWFMWENHFPKTMVYVEKYFKKQNYNVYVVFYLKQIVEPYKLTKAFITMKFYDGEHANFGQILHF